jgi:2-polyprenyl-3-methyl-5-hydroxy-6-metoxy-1,4-benzoquinol methylase
MADPDAIRAEFAEVARRYGPWTAHNVELAPGVFTISSEPSGDEVKLRRIVQIVGDLVDGRFDELRVLDLACLEGMYALELAKRGAHVVAIEGREANLEKARFSARALGLDAAIEFLQGDVRGLSRLRHGEFDVVLCLGILYHLDASDVFPFVERLAEVCRRGLIVDTNVSLRPRDTHRSDGHLYRGERLFEHDPSSTREERLRAVWSSLDNTSAWIPTKPSLLTLLARAGFTSVYECFVPAEPEKTPARLTIVALQGAPQAPLLAPRSPADPATVPERPPLGARIPSTPLWRLGRLVPSPLRRRLRAALGAEIRRH